MADVPGASDDFLKWQAEQEAKIRRPRVPTSAQIAAADAALRACLPEELFDGSQRGEAYTKHLAHVAAQIATAIVNVRDE